MQQFAAREIGERIAQARREAGGMTQEQLAELLNVSARSVQDYESGVTVPWKHMHALTRIFTRPLEWFLHGDEADQEEDIHDLDARVSILEEDLDRLAAIAEAIYELNRIAFRALGVKVKLPELPQRTARRRRLPRERQGALGG